MIDLFCLFKFNFLFKTLWSNCYKMFAIDMRIKLFFIEYGLLTQLLLLMSVFLLFFIPSVDTCFSEKKYESSRCLFLRITNRIKMEFHGQFCWQRNGKFLIVQIYTCPIVLICFETHSWMFIQRLVLLYTCGRVEFLIKRLTFQIKKINISQSINGRVLCKGDSLITKLLKW